MLVAVLQTSSVVLLLLGSERAWRLTRAAGRRRGALLLAAGLAAAGFAFVPHALRGWAGTDDPMAVGDAVLGTLVAALLYAGVAVLAWQIPKRHASAEALRSVEEALEESESRYRSMLAAMTEGAILRDGEGRVLAVNAAAERLLGRRGDELKRLAENPSDERLLADDGTEMDPRDLPSLITLRTGLPITGCTLGVQRPDGKLVWLRINATPLIRKGAARPHGAMATMTDVTEARRIEEELRRSHERTGAILESITDGFLSVDRTWNVGYVNSSAAELLGVEPDELVGEELASALPMLADSALGAHCRTAMDEGEVVHFEEFIDGIDDWYAGTVYPFEGGLSLYFRRVTDEHEARRAVRDSEDRFRTLAENVPVVVYLCDSSPDYPFLFLSEAIFELTGWERADFLEGRTSLEEMYHPDDAPHVMPKVHAALRERRSYDLKVRIRHRDGTWRWIEEIGVGVFRDEKLLYLEGYLVDITERRDTEERQRLMMAELDHRVKNNITTIMALAQQTIARSADLPDFSERFLGRIRAMARTHEALAAARWDGVVLRDVLRLTLGPYVGLVDGRIEAEGDEVSLPAGAATSIGLAIHELTTNAVKHGALSRESGRLHLSWRREGEEVQLTWKERDVDGHAPPPRAPEPASPTGALPGPSGGLGTTLLRGLVEYELGGSVRHDLTPEGLTCELRIALGGVRDDRSRVR